MSLRFDVSDLAKGIDRHKAMVEYGLRQSASMEAKRLAIQAQRDKPWRDQSGAARRGIHGRVDQQPKGLRISISGSVRYMVYLELAHGKKWAVLWPTIEKHGARAVENIAKFMGRLK